MKVNRAKFERMLRMLMLPKTGNILLPVVQLKFANDGLEVRQFDDSFTVAVIAKFYKNYFENYETIGEVKFDTELLDGVKRRFKEDEVIDLTVKDEWIEIIGKIDRYKVKQPATSCNVIEPEKLKRIGKITMSAKVKAKKVYTLDSAFLRDLGDKVYFTYGKKLIASVRSKVAVFERNVPYNHAEGDASGEVVVPGDILERVLGNLSGSIYLIFTDSPLINVTQLTSEFEISYNIPTMVKEE